jgi:hypothetical protein
MTLDICKLNENQIKDSIGCVYDGSLRDDSISYRFSIKKEKEGGILNAFAKVYLSDNKNNGMRVESEIYELYIDRIYKKRHTPNVLRLFQSTKCNTKQFKNLIEKGIGTESAQCMTILDSEETDDHEQIHILVLEDLVHYIKLEEMVNNLTDRDFFSVLFQVLFTLEVFNRYDIRHNDLNLKKILLQRCTINHNQKHYKYLIEGEIYYIPVDYLAIVIDFDYGCVPNSIYSNRITDEICEEFGICNVSDKKYDTFVFLVNLLNNRDEYNETVINFLYANIPDALLEPVSSNKYESVLSVDQRNSDDYTTNMKNTLELLKNEVFNIFKIKPEDCEIVDEHSFYLPDDNNFSDINTNLNDQQKRIIIPHYFCYV